MKEGKDFLTLIGVQLLRALLYDNKYLKKLWSSIVRQ